MCVCVWVWVCVRVCESVCERERERIIQKGIPGTKFYQQYKTWAEFSTLDASVCVFATNSNKRAKIEAQNSAQTNFRFSLLRSFGIFEQLGYETTQLPSGGGEGVFKIYWPYRLKNYKIPGSLPSPAPLKTPLILWRY